MSGRIIRAQRRYERDFTQIRNADLRDEKLSYVARGILGMLLTHEHGRPITLKDIAAASPREGLDLCRSAVNELEQLGYLRRYTRPSRGRFTADDWELLDPNAPEELAFTALAQTTRQRSTALAQTTRTALAQTTRTALAQTTPIKNTKKNTPRSSTSATTEAPVDNRCTGGCGRPRSEWGNARHSETCCMRCIVEPGWYEAVAS